MALVVCVDDDPSIGEAVKSFLEACGYQAEVFSSAESFLGSGLLDQAQCVITDVKLGGMSGIELLETLANAACRIPVIVITAFPERGVREEALRRGATAFFEKPFRIKELLEPIRSAVGDRG